MIKRILSSSTRPYIHRTKPAMEDILAGIGITLGALASLPQIMKSCKTGTTTDLDARSMVLRMSAAFVWGVWSVVKDDRAILYSALANLIVEGILLFTKLLYKKTEEHQ